jgi:ABC-type transport system substrate-binding protein
MKLERKLAVQLFTIVMLCALMPFLVVPTAVEPLPVAAAAPAATTLSASGPYADSIIYKVITGQDVQVAALVSGDIDHLADFVTGSYVADLQANPAITVSQTERLGFGHMSINCARYPFSSVHFRRAIAYCVDKYEVASIMWESLGFPLDSVVPASCGGWYNNHTYPNYYEPDIAAAEAELAAGGFVDVNHDGLVEAPNGQPFLFHIYYSAAGTNWGAALQASKVHWDAAGIPTAPTPMDFNAFITKVQTIPRDYDAACFGYGLTSPISGPTSLEAWMSNEIANPYGNIWNWANDTFDAQVETVLSATDYETVLEACYDAQETIVQNVPIIVLYSNWVVDAYRNGKWEGFVLEPGHGTGQMNYWTPRQVRLKVGQAGRDPLTGCGGTFLSMISQDIDTQNPLTSTTTYGGYVSGQIYQGLMDLNDPVTLAATKDNGGLTYDYTIQDLGNQLKFTFTLYTNATWHDGVPVTAEDIAFSYNYIKANNLPRYSTVIPYLDNATVQDASHVIIYTNKAYSGARSYWAFEFLRNWVIIPKHVWEGIVSPVTFTNPVPIGCGPYKWYRRIEGEYVQLNFWELYHRGITNHQVGPTAPVSYLWVYVTVGALVIVVVLLGSVWYLRKK